MPTVRVLVKESYVYILSRVACRHRDGSRGPRQRRVHDHRRTHHQDQAIQGWFRPPHGTIELGIDRQPDGYTCGTETFMGICELLRLPLHDPDDQTLRWFEHKLHTDYRTGTDPEHVVEAATKFGLEAEFRGLSMDELAAKVNGAQDYIRHLLDGGKPDKPLELVMVSYQAYVDRDHEWSDLYPEGRRRGAPMKRQRIRTDDWKMRWENDWSDGHWSAVVRVVGKRDPLLASIREHVPECKDGVVVLADPSNGEGLSFVPSREFDKRWHDTDRHDKPLAHDHPSVVLRAPVDLLEQLRARANKHRVPMFATTARNAVIYVP